MLCNIVQVSFYTACDMDKRNFEKAPSSSGNTDFRAANLCGKSSEPLLPGNAMIVLCSGPLGIIGDHSENSLCLSSSCTSLVIIKYMLTKQASEISWLRRCFSPYYTILQLNILSHQYAKEPHIRNAIVTHKIIFLM